MNEHPALFSTRMVEALLKEQDPKTATRRIAHFKPLHEGLNFSWSGLEAGLYFTDVPERGWVLRARRGDGCWEDKTHPLFCPYGNVGDRIWARETWRAEELESGLDGIRFKADNTFRPIENTVSAADAWVEAYIPYLERWRPSIFMPRWASRITLEITGLCVERLQSITDRDICHELGCPEVWKGEGPEPYKRDLRGIFSELWDSINAKRGYPWASDPWVWAIEFRKIQ